MKRSYSEGSGDGKDDDLLALEGVGGQLGGCVAWGQIWKEDGEKRRHDDDDKLTPGAVKSWMKEGTDMSNLPSIFWSHIYSVPTA